MYLPDRDIGEDYKLKVTYGAGAGLDRLNTDVRLLNYRSSNVISAEKVLEETDFVENAQDELNRVEAEEARRIILQRFEGDMQIPIDALIATYAYQQENGGDLVTAAIAVKALGQQFSQPQQGTQQAAPPGEVPAEAPPGSQPSGVPGAAAPQNVPPAFAPPPMQQTFPRYAL